MVADTAVRALSDDAPSPISIRNSSSPASGLLPAGDASGVPEPTKQSDDVCLPNSSASVEGQQQQRQSRQNHQHRMVEVSLEQVSDHQFLSLLKMKFKKSRRQELELKELQRLFVSEEQERQRLAEENAVLTRKLEEERGLREAADSLAAALREDNQRLTAEIEELNIRLVHLPLQICLGSHWLTVQRFAERTKGRDHNKRVPHGSATSGEGPSPQEDAQAIALRSRLNKTLSS